MLNGTNTDMLVHEQSIIQVYAYTLQGWIKKMPFHLRDADRLCFCQVCAFRGSTSVAWAFSSFKLEYPSLHREKQNETESLALDIETR